MTITVENKYGSYVPARPYYIDQYGITDNQYGVIADPETFSFLLCENGDFLVQEDGGKILLD